MTPPFNYLSASLNNIDPSSQDALSGFSISSLKSFYLFYFPQMRPAILMSLLVVFIEVVKEQPATLLLRPVGFETLSSKIYNYTSEGQWVLASVPSLFLILVCLIFVYILNKGIDLKNNN
jgi:iron(III) transport system permease protein